MKNAHHSQALLDRLLSIAVSQDASDIHLAPGLTPRFRLQGELLALPELPDLTAGDLRELAGVLAGQGQPELEAGLTQRGSLDGAITAPDRVRFRFNIFRRQAEVAIALRRLEDRFRSLAELGLPDSLYGLCDLRDGLVVVTGPTGSGKSTTLATLVDRINRVRDGHIITIEDPIEYLHIPVRCVVNQRQIGLDSPGFNEALVAALRQDPDVILVGEIRDLDTIRTAITAAETGHLVFTTLHAGDCVGAIERLVAVFPAGEQEGMRRQLSLVLRSVVAQHLLPARADGAAGRASRAVASEILGVTPAVANLIATARSSQIYSTMESGASAGMQTLEHDLARLWVAGRLAETTAMAMARHPTAMQDRAAFLRRQPGEFNAPRTGARG